MYAFCKLLPMIRSSCSFKMAPNVIEVSDFNPSVVPFPHLSELTETSGWRPDRLCDRVDFESIEEEEGGEEEQQDALVKQDVSTPSTAPQSQSNSCFVGVGTSVGVMTGAGAGSTCPTALKNRRIVKWMCSSALILVSITVLLLLLPVVLPPLPPPPSELMLLPVAILLLLVCAALSPRSPSLPASATSAPSPQSMPLLPLAHSLPLRSTMPC